MLMLAHTIYVSHLDDNIISIEFHPQPPQPDTYCSFLKTQFLLAKKMYFFSLCFTQLNAITFLDNTKYSWTKLKEFYLM